MTDRRPSAGFWIIVALVAVLVGYPLSFGPACWMSDEAVVSVLTIERVYRPVVFVIQSPSLPGGSLIADYARWCGGGRTVLQFTFDMSPRVGGVPLSVSATRSVSLKPNTTVAESARSG